MRFKYIFISILFLFILFSCKQTNDSPSIKNISSVDSLDIKPIISNDDEKTLKRILKQQLRKGKSALYDNSFDVITYKYSSKDLDVTLPILKEKLISYIVPDNEEFKAKVRKIFGRTIDYKTDSKYLYVNLGNNTDRKKKFYRNDNSIEIRPFGVFIVKDGNYITSLYALPELLDYKKQYPEIFDFEKTISIDQKNEDGEPLKLNKWMDDESNDINKTIKTFLARNKYLFNDDKSQLDWLLENDEEFMASLISTYNYSKDQKHKVWFENRN